MKLTGKVTLKPRVVQIRCWHCQSTLAGDDPRYYSTVMTENCPYCGVALILPTTRPLDPRDVYVAREGQEGVWEEQSEVDLANNKESVPRDIWTPDDIDLIRRLLIQEEERLAEEAHHLQRLLRQVSRLGESEEEEED